MSPPSLGEWKNKNSCLFAQLCSEFVKTCVHYAQFQMTFKIFKTAELKEETSVYALEASLGPYGWRREKG